MMHQCHTHSLSLVAKRHLRETRGPCTLAPVEHTSKLYKILFGAALVLIDLRQLFRLPSLLYCPTDRPDIRPEIAQYEPWSLPDMES